MVDSAVGGVTRGSVMTLTIQQIPREPPQIDFYQNSEMKMISADHGNINVSVSGNPLFSNHHDILEGRENWVKIDQIEKPNMPLIEL